MLHDDIVTNDHSVLWNVTNRGCIKRYDTIR